MFTKVYIKFIKNSGVRPNRRTFVYPLWLHEVIRQRFMSPVFITTSNTRTATQSTKSRRLTSYVAGGMILMTVLSATRPRRTLCRRLQGDTDRLNYCIHS